MIETDRITGKVTKKINARYIARAFVQPTSGQIEDRSP